MNRKVNCMEPGRILPMSLNYSTTSLHSASYISQLLMLLTIMLNFISSVLVFVSFISLPPQNANRILAT